LSSLTVVNANDRFVQYNDAGDNFFKETLKKRNIKVETGVKLVEINKDNQTAVWKNIVTGETTTKWYNNLYVITPTKPNQPLVDAGLTNSNGLLNVDH